MQPRIHPIATTTVADATQKTAKGRQYIDCPTGLQLVFKNCLLLDFVHTFEHTCLLNFDYKAFRKFGIIVSLESLSRQ